MDFQYVVDHGHQFPLPVDLLPTPQAKSIDSQGGVDVAKDRFHDAEPFAVVVPPSGTVYLPFHLFDEADLSVPCDPEIDVDGPRALLVGSPETLAP